MAAAVTSRESWCFQEPKKTIRKEDDEEEGLVLEHSSAPPTTTTTTTTSAREQDRERYSYNNHCRISQGQNNNSRKRPLSKSPHRPTTPTNHSYHSQHQKGSKSEPWKVRGESSRFPHYRNEAQPSHPRSNNNSNNNRNMCNTPFRIGGGRDRDSADCRRNNNERREEYYAAKPKSQQWQRNSGGNATASREEYPSRRNDGRGDCNTRPQDRSYSDTTAARLPDEDRRYGPRNIGSFPIFRERGPRDWREINDNTSGDGYFDRRSNNDYSPRYDNDDDVDRRPPTNNGRFQERDRRYYEDSNRNERNSNGCFQDQGGKFQDRQSMQETAQRYESYSNPDASGDRQRRRFPNNDSRLPMEQSQRYHSYDKNQGADRYGDRNSSGDRLERPRYEEDSLSMGYNCSDSTGTSRMDAPRFVPSARENPNRNSTDSKFASHPRDGNRHSSDNYGYPDQRTFSYDHDASRSMCDEATTTSTTATTTTTTDGRSLESQRGNNYYYNYNNVRHGLPAEDSDSRNASNAWNHPTPQGQTFQESPRSQALLQRKHSPLKKRQWLLEEDATSHGSAHERNLGESRNEQLKTVLEHGPRKEGSMPSNVHARNEAFPTTLGQTDVSTTVQKMPPAAVTETSQEKSTMKRAPSAPPASSAANNAKMVAESKPQDASSTANKSSLGIPLRWLKPTGNPKKPVNPVVTKKNLSSTSVEQKAIPRNPPVQEKKVDKSGGSSSSCPSSPSLNRLVTDSEGGSTISNNLVMMVENKSDRQQVPSAIVTKPTSNSKVDSTEDDIYKSDNESSFDEMKVVAKSPATKIASGSSSVGESSVDSDTDDEEVMMWASKMFGVPVRSSPTKLANSSDQLTEKPSPTKKLRLKLKLPRPKPKLELEVNPSAVKNTTKKFKKKKKKRKRDLENQSSAENVVAKKRQGRPKKMKSMEPEPPSEITQDENKQVATEEERTRKESAKPLTAEQIKAILGEDDFAMSAGTNWVRRSVRQPSRDLLNAKTVKALVEKLKNSHPDMIVLKMKKFVNDPNAPQVVLDAALDALEENTNCQTLYIQNFNEGMRDDQVLHLLTILQQPKCRIWCLNIGENYNVKTKTWDKFTKGLKKTKVTHMYASEHTITTEMKDEIRATIRNNRMKHDMHINPNNLHVIVQCTHCWWNPINAKVLRPYLKNEGFEYILKDIEVQGLRGSTSAAPSV